MLHYGHIFRYFLEKHTICIVHGHMFRYLMKIGVGVLIFLKVTERVSDSF